MASGHSRFSRKNLSPHALRMVALRWHTFRNLRAESFVFGVPSRSTSLGGGIFFGVTVDPPARSRQHLRPAAVSPAGKCHYETGVRAMVDACFLLAGGRRRNLAMIVAPVSRGGIIG